MLWTANVAGRAIPEKLYAAAVLCNPGSARSSHVSALVCEKSHSNQSAYSLYQSLATSLSQRASSKNYDSSATQAQCTAFN